VLPYILQFNAASSACEEKLAFVARQVFGEEVHGLSNRQAAFYFIHAIADLQEEMELPKTLKGWSVPESQLDEFAEYIFKERQYIYGLPRFNPRKLSLENTKELMHQMYDGTFLS
jgi:alcohol dehydrogenase class IV